MFADYRVPQILCAFGVLKYSDSLLERLNAEEEPIEKRLEIEIRGCSIHAVELVRNELKLKLSTDGRFNAVTIDFYLWDEAKRLGAEISQFPIHKTRTIFY